MKFVQNFSHRLGLWIFGKKTTEVKYHFQHIISRVHTINMTCHCWYWPWYLAEEVFLRFLHYKVNAFPPFLCCTLWKKITVLRPCLRNGKLCTISLKVRHLYKLLTIFLNTRFVYSPSLIIQSFIYNSMESGMFML